VTSRAGIRAEKKERIKAVNTTGRTEGRAKKKLKRARREFEKRY
jgi:hypothetical protein